MLADTDVLIWFLRGYESAVDRLNQVEELHLSVVTYMELVQGMKNKRELQALRRTIDPFQWRIILLDNAIALIAATAVQNGLVLLTANEKHYRMIQELQLDIFRPE